MSKEHKFKRGDNVRQKFVGTGIPREYGKVLRYEHGGEWAKANYPIGGNDNG